MRCGKFCLQLIKENKAHRAELKLPATVAHCTRVEILLVLLAGFPSTGGALT